MPKHYLGVDYHKAYSVLCLKDEYGQTLRQRKINNTRGEVESFIKGYDCLQAFERTKILPSNPIGRLDFSLGL